MCTYGYWVDSDITESGLWLVLCLLDSLLLAISMIALGQQFLLPQSGQLLAHHSSWVKVLFFRTSLPAGCFLVASQKHSLLHSAFLPHSESGFLQECHYHASGLLLFLLQWQPLSWLSLLPICCLYYPIYFCLSLQTSILDSFCSVWGSITQGPSKVVCPGHLWV